MRSPNNEGDETPTSHLLSTNEASSSGTWLQSIWVVDQGGTIDILKQPKLLLKSVVLYKLTAGAPLMRTTLTWLTELGEAELVPTWSFHPCSDVFGVRMYSAGYQRRRPNSNPAKKPLTYTLFLLKDMLEQRWHRTCGRNNQYLIWLMVHSTNAQHGFVIKNEIVQRPIIKPNTTGLKNQ